MCSTHTYGNQGPAATVHGGSCRWLLLSVLVVSMLHDDGIVSNPSQDSFTECYARRDTEQRVCWSCHVLGCRVQSQGQSLLQVLHGWVTVAHATMYKLSSSSVPNCLTNYPNCLLPTLWPGLPAWRRQSINAVSTPLAVPPDPQISKQTHAIARLKQSEVLGSNPYAVPLIPATHTNHQCRTQPMPLDMAAIATA
jgi:hypothetical protein